MCNIYLVHSSQSPEKVISKVEGEQRRGSNGGLINSSHYVRQPPIRWLYLGKDYLRLIEWEQSLPESFRRIHYAEQLQELAMRWRKSYVNWITTLGQQKNSLVWWTSTIAERNTLLDSLYHRICYLQIALQFAVDDRSPLLIIAESRAVLQTLTSHPELQPRIKWGIKTNRLHESLKWAIRLVFVWARKLFIDILTHYDAWVTRNDTPVLPPSTEKVRILFHSFLNGNSINDDGTVRDPYFTELPAELRGRGYDVVVLPVLFNLAVPEQKGSRWLNRSPFRKLWAIFGLSQARREAFRKFRKRSSSYLIAEDFYTLKDYFWAAQIIIRQAWLLTDRAYRFEELDITKLVREACLLQSMRTGVANSVRYVRLVKKWKELGLKIEFFIDRFENLLPEKPPIIGFRQYMPHVMTVGFQHYLSFYPLWLCVSSTSIESRIAPQPDVIVCNSPWTAMLFAQEGFPAQKLRVGPSLRYLHLIDQKIKATPKSNSVLVILSLEANATTEVMHKLLDAFPTDENIRFYIKIHPMMSITQWRLLLNGRKLPDHMEQVDGSMADWLPLVSCAVVIASTAAFEIVLAGIPVTLVGRETDFDMNPLFWFPELPGAVYSVEELRKEVVRMLSYSDTEREEFRLWSQKIREQCLSPISDATIDAFVQPVR